MPVKATTKTMVFGEQDEGFIKQLAKDIGCHYSRANERTYNLNKFDSAVQSEMGVFAWVHKGDSSCFWVSTRKVWVEKARAKETTGRKKPVPDCFPRDNHLAEDSVKFDTQSGYLKTVSALKLIKKIC